MSQTNELKKIRMHFPEISSKAWEHPADRAALVALRKVPGLDLVLQKLIGVTTEKSLRLIALASSIRVTERQYPKVHGMLREACATLDVATIPELYIAQNPFLNASAIGVDRPFIVLHSSLVEAATDDELLCIVGHELGHVVSGHALYKPLLALLVRLSSFALSIPLGGASILAIIMALREWDRKSELSADRAGLLVVQDPEVAYRIDMKLAGATRPEQIDINEFFAQAAEYEKGEGLLDSFHKLMNLIGQSHPFPVLRLTELKTWVDSGAYGTIMSGDYVRRTADADTVRDTMREAAGSYREDFATSQDPLAELLRNAWENTDGMRSKAKDAFDSVFGRAKE
jgi:Zn-dependent protease with chaperone function